MKPTILRLVLMVALAVLPLAAKAVMTDAEAATLVQNMLADNKSANDIIETLMQDGRSLEDATVMAVKNSEGLEQFNLARVGICLSEDVTRAEKVGRACLDECTPESRDIIESLIEGYVTGACAPPEVEYISTPSGGGSVSPST